MTTDDKREAVRQEIIKAVPAVMDLVFGCVFTYGRKGKRGVYVRRNTRDMIEFKTQEEGHSYVTEDAIIEVIGRPITLADVLVAIGETEHRSEVGVNFDSDGAYIYYDDMENASGSKWDLSQDFGRQSEAVWEFLYQLLVENK